jgi:hypothetical protein
MFDEKTLFDFCLQRTKCQIILFLTSYESFSKSRWTKIMSILKNCYQNRRFVFWNRQKWNLFRSIFILMKALMKKHRSLLIVCILSYWTLINSVRIMRMILSWWWTIIKSEFKSWIVNFSIRCKKSQFTSATNERCRSMRYFICRWTWSIWFWRFIMNSLNSRCHFAAIFELMSNFEIVKRFDSTTLNFIRHRSSSFKVTRLVLSSFFESSFKEQAH